MAGMLPEYVEAIILLLKVLGWRAFLSPVPLGERTRIRSADGI
jgi:hypothetical protein